MAPVLIISSSLLIYFIFLPFSSGIDTLTPTKSLKDGETLNSTGGTFSFGFFSPGTSTNRYAGIWHTKIPVQTVVWVANREKPINNSLGFLTIRDDGNLAIFDEANNTVWSTNVSLKITISNIKLLDSGNLELTEGNSYNPNRVLWQSFDYPTDTHLPDMKLGLNRRTNMNWSLTSWKSADDPAPGEFSYAVDPRGLPQFIIYKGSNRYWRSGPWTGQRLSGAPDMPRNDTFNFSYVSNEYEIYISVAMYNASIITKAVLDSSGILQRMTWVDSYRRWHSFGMDPADPCDDYAECGVYSSCNAADNAPECECLHGFEPRSPREWFLRDGSGGCVRRKALGCGEEDGFLKVVRVKLPDTSTARLERVSDFVECERACRNNCSCTAYASLDGDESGGRCVLWDGDLTDIRVFADVEQDMYIRLHASELDANSNAFDGKKLVATTIASAAVGIILLFSVGCYLWRRKKIRKGKMEERNRRMIFNLSIGSTGNIKRGKFSDAIELENGVKSPDVRFYDMHGIVASTDNFSSKNKLGEGGFGPVYKGKLHNGREIAVKRLSKNSGQGGEEFKNEVILIAKLQHRNLVRLLGCCIWGEEKMLIYEYMPNRSLDTFIFDQTKSMLLDWKMRFDIILGIARGVLYLHQDSILTIIHRDLKASNILLDAEMNPKISDFGMARIFGGKQTQANTNRVVGTYGYMSPEYAMEGLFSVKSDVYSFGVLLLEIVTGTKNSGYYADDPSLSLIKNIWNMWKEGKALELADSSMLDLCPTGVLRCIQVGLLCVQASTIDRPTMSSVVLMLSTETTIPSPKQPAFFFPPTQNQPSVSNSSTVGKYSINQVTISIMKAR